MWDFPVVLLDEMESAERSDMDGVKNAMTRYTKSGRAMYSGTTNTVRVRSTFWGTANGTLGDKIADTTGVQRFGPVPTKHKPVPENIAAGLPVMNYEDINSTDFLKLWQSVGHLAAHPLQSDPEARAEWVQLCEAERAQDSVEAWLRQLDGRVVIGVPNATVTTAHLYEREKVGYADWCKRNGMGALAMPKLGKRMKGFSFQPWYPFEPPVRVREGTVHKLKTTLSAVPKPERVELESEIVTDMTA